MIEGKPSVSHDANISEPKKKAIMRQRQDKLRLTAKNVNNNSNKPTPITSARVGPVRLVNPVDDIIKKNSPLATPPQAQHRMPSIQIPAQLQKEEEEKEGEEGQMGLSPRWRIPFGELAFSDTLGKGGFGVVYKGRYAAKDVAIKRMLQGNHDFNKYLERELLSLRRIDHPNVVKFIGYCLHVQPLGRAGSLPIEDIFLVTEFMAGGDLADKLKNPAYCINLKLRLRILRDVSQAIRYLHSIGIPFSLSLSHALTYVLPKKRVDIA